MILDQRIDYLASQMAPEAAGVYRAMIADYQSGYADYVYQTDKPEIQARRIKNLNKSFLRLLTEPYYYFLPLSQTAAEEIVETWTYPAPYDSYDLLNNPKEMAELLSEEERGSHYFQVLRSGAFYASVGFFPSPDGLELHLRVNPKFVGKGYGLALMEAIENHVQTNLEAERLLISLPAFDQRSRHICQKAGFQVLEEKSENFDDQSLTLFKLLKT